MISRFAKSDDSDESAGSDSCNQLIGRINNLVVSDSSDSSSSDPSMHGDKSKCHKLTRNSRSDASSRDLQSASADLLSATLEDIRAKVGLISPERFCDTSERSVRKSLSLNSIDSLRTPIRRYDSSSSDAADAKYDAFVKSITQSRKRPKFTSRRSLDAFIVPDWAVDSSDQSYGEHRKRFREPVGGGDTFLDIAETEERTTDFGNYGSKRFEEKTANGRDAGLHTGKRIRATGGRETPCSLMTLLKDDSDDPRATEYRKFFPKLRAELARRMFEEVNREVFKSRLQTDLSIVWSGRLRATAGRCVIDAGVPTCIELSSKVCDTPGKLRDTLVHEMCHVAVAAIDGQPREGHGRLWRRWTRKLMKKYPFLPPIRRCHNYDTFQSIVYKCVQCNCETRKQVRLADNASVECSKCKQVMVPVSRAYNDFAKFVQSNYRDTRRPGMSHAQAMVTLSSKYRQTPRQQGRKSHSCDENRRCTKG